MEHPPAERPGHLPLACYTFGADAMGYLRHLGIRYSGPEPWHDPGAETCRRRLWLIEIKNLEIWLPFVSTAVTSTENYSRLRVASIYLQ